jgi:hypothetical protein
VSVGGGRRGGRETEGEEGQWRGRDERERERRRNERERGTGKKEGQCERGKERDEGTRGSYEWVGHTILLGMNQGEEGFAGRRGRRTRKSHITKKTENDQQEELGKGLGQEDCTKSGWEAMPRPIATRGVGGRASEVQRRVRKCRGGRCRDEYRRAKEEIEREVA